MCAFRSSSRSCSGHRFVRLATLSTLCAAAWLAPAQDVVDQAIWTVGTVTRDAQNQDWAYVLWKPTSPDLVTGRSFAVYSKAGPPAGPAGFQRAGIVRPRNSAAAIQPLLVQAAALGDDLSRLEAQLNNLFVNLDFGALPTLAEKLATVVRGSIGQPDNFQNLLLLGGEHPAVNLAAGLGFASPIPAAGSVTFEVRDYDLARDVDLAVLGRVTVQAGQPVVLPPPGPVVHVPENSAAGDLNIKLRWATPPDLRRVSLLQHGFNVYRMPLELAMELGLDQTPPTPEDLHALVAGNPLVVRVNNLPVLPPADFTAQDVGAFQSQNPGMAGPGGEIFFIADDNGRYRAGGQPFVNGAQFLYFVAARDVLGRDGRVSLGGLATACDRLPPNAPEGVRVENDYSDDAQGQPVQSLRVFWEPQVEDGSDTVVAYYVYRWDSATEAQLHLGNPLAGVIAGPIGHVPGVEEMTFLDHGPLSPMAPADYNRTFWYTVRSVDAGACTGGNFSPPSAPAFGVLRDRTGPDGPDGALEILCCEPVVTARTPVARVDAVEQHAERAYFRLTCARDTKDVAWAEFAFGQGHPAEALGRIQFAPEFNEVLLLTDLGRQEGGGGELTFYCRVGSRAGLVSDYGVVRVISLPPATQRLELPFTATIQCATQTVAAGPVPTGCTTHQASIPGQTAIQPVCLTVALTPSTQEYRIYRRIDFGPLELIEQGLADQQKVPQVNYCDFDLPPAAATVCYYAQLLDEHGNPSPMRQIGACLGLQNLNLLPTPSLTALEPAGDAVQPKMRIRWFCPPPGVERFEVAIARRNGLTPAQVSGELSAATSVSPRQKTYRLTDQAFQRQFQLYRTRVIGPSFGEGAQFAVEVAVEAGEEYDVVVAAVDPSGGVGEDSNAARLVWETPAPAPQVPWPARPFAGTATWDPRLQAEQLPAATYPGAAIRIGDFKQDTYLKTSADTPAAIAVLKGAVSVESLLYQRQGQSLLPFVLYRVQVACPGPDPTHPDGGGLAQVSPLMEQIAINQALDGGNGMETQVVDPYLTITSAYDQGRFPNNGRVNIYLRDVHPVIIGACYQYLFVRMAPNGEIAEVIPTNILQIQQP